MAGYSIAAALLVASLASCTGAPSRTRPFTAATTPRPLDTLPAEADLGVVRDDLIATATARYGSNSLSEALAAPTYLIAKRFVGMAPPPPAGDGHDWVPPTPTALLLKRPDGWMVATSSGWRPAEADAAGELDQVLRDPHFWSEPALIPACPDYGASLLLLKMAGKAAVVRKSTCTSVAEKAVFAALRA